jgi:hypothetical protein
MHGLIFTACSKKNISVNYLLINKKYFFKNSITMVIFYHSQSIRAQKRVKLVQNEFPVGG